MKGINKLLIGGILGLSGTLSHSSENIYFEEEIGGVVVTRDSYEKCKVSSIELIKEFEDFRGEAYKCGAGKLTIGYGHTGGVRIGDRITRKTAERILIEDIKKYENAISKNVKTALTPEQFNVLTSFVYNIGIGAFQNSTLLKKLNERDYLGAGNEMNRWIKVNGTIISKGLVRRRAEEKKLFLKYMPR